jgi:hypothetical protein
MINTISNVPLASKQSNSQIYKNRRLTAEETNAGTQISVTAFKKKNPINTVRKIACFFKKYCTYFSTQSSWSYPLTFSQTKQPQEH